MIKAAFERLVDENRHPLSIGFEDEERLYIFDGVRRLIYVAEYNSALSEAVRGSKLFEELPVNTFDVGQTIRQKRGMHVFTIERVDYDNKCYWYLNGTLSLPFDSQDNYELAIPIIPRFIIGDVIKNERGTFEITDVDFNAQHYIVPGGTISFFSQDTYEPVGHKPRFEVGQVIVSKENPEIRYYILEAGIPNETGEYDYKVKNLSKEYIGTTRLISINKMDVWGVPIEELEKEAHVSGIPVSALDQMPEIKDFDDAVAKALGLPSNLVKEALAEFNINFEGMKQRWLSDACEWLRNYLQPACIDAYSEPEMQAFVNRSVERFRKHMDKEVSNDK